MTVRAISLAIALLLASCQTGSTRDGEPDTEADGGADDDLSATESCEAAAESRSTIGCEYWAVDLDNSENFSDKAAAGQFAVAVANVSHDGAVTVQAHLNNAPQGYPLDLQLVEEHSIPENDLYIFNLPRRDADGDSVQENSDDGPQTWLSSRAFRIKSDKPVVAYQFNTLDQQYSNDASLLIPTSALGKDHLILGYPPSTPWGPLVKNRAYVTVVGVEEGTSVKVNPTFDIEAGEGVPAIPGGSNAEFEIGPFDVLNLETRLLTQSEQGGPKPDLSGSEVFSDKPVAVFFGTDMSMIQEQEVVEDCCAEHIEQQIIPSESMGYVYVVSHSAQRNVGDTPEKDCYRIMSYSDGASVTTNLAPPNDAFTLSRGQFKEFFVNTGFTVSSTKPLHVGQFLVIGTETDLEIGDSSLLYVPALAQRRSFYIFTTGKNFAYNYAVISKAEGTLATLDGQDISTSDDCRGPFIDGQIGGKTYEAWTCLVEDGSHTIHSGATLAEAEAPLGVFVYGYYDAGSYSYPAGSDLLETNDDIIE